MRVQRYAGPYIYGSYSQGVSFLDLLDGKGVGDMRRMESTVLTTGPRPPPPPNPPPPPPRPPPDFTPNPPPSPPPPSPHPPQRLNLCKCECI
eukprot:4486501-Prymnesium_polylepis.1